MRGEHDGTGGRGLKVLGPSPRARGALDQPVRGDAVGGTIPACAGSTRNVRVRPTSGRDHPRVRGEHSATRDAVMDGTGPSPRARGAQRHPRRRHGRHGTIPACAGSTVTVMRGLPSRWDHPRVRGEHAFAQSSALALAGPSPRARGARSPGGRRSRVAGTIPACAGSTDFLPLRGFVVGDHPRVRGEHSRSSSRRAAVRGPSPRARGAPHGAGEPGEHLGTIPACAGSTRTSTPAGSGRRDHPRVRGEHGVAWVALLTVLGPSPRARGARWPRAARARRAGTIPACAGSTRSRPARR